MRIRVGHISLQFNDSSRQHTHDIEKVFDRAVKRRLAWVMGTESGIGAGNTSRELARIGKAHGYRTHIPSLRDAPGRNTDCWIAVRSDLVKSGWKPGYVPVIPGSRELYKDIKPDPPEFPKWGPKGLVTVEFNSIPELGAINLLATHHLTKGATKGRESVIHGVDHYAWNQRMDRAISKWVAEQAKGTALVFGSMDRNASDRRTDSIEGTTTLADELKKWQNTGHGDIDWIFSANRDTRVTGHNFTVLDDREFKLYTDHWYLEGVFKVEPLKR